MRNKPIRSKTGKATSVLLSLLLLCIMVNSSLTWIVGTKVRSLEVQPPAPPTTLEGKEPGKKRQKWQRKTMPPQESSQSTAGFIHIGKTGGSTISKLLHNGCTSFVAGPCRNITNESIVSQKVVREYESRVAKHIHTLTLFLSSPSRSTIITFRTFIGCLLRITDLSSFQFEMFMNEQSPLSSTIIRKMLL